MVSMTVTGHSIAVLQPLEPDGARDLLDPVHTAIRRSRLLCIRFGFRLLRIDFLADFLFLVGGIADRALIRFRVCVRCFSASRG